MNEDAFDASRDQLVLLVVEVHEVDRAQLAHVQHGHHVAQFVQKDEFELRGDD